MTTEIELRGKALKALHDSTDLLKQSDGVDEVRARELIEQSDKAFDESVAFEERADEMAKRAALQVEIEAKIEALNAVDTRGIYSDGKASVVADTETSLRDAFAGFYRGNLTSENRAALREYEERAQSTSNTEGGYTVPTTFGGLVETLKAFGPMLDGTLVNKIDTAGGNPLTFATNDDTGNSAAYRGEGTGYTANANLSFGQVILNAYFYGSGILKVSNELISDSGINIVDYVNSKLFQRVARSANYQLTNGNGSNAPNGLFYGARVGVTSVANNAITADEILDFIDVIDGAYLPNAQFTLNKTILKNIRKLKTSGSGEYLLAPGISVGTPSTIWGYSYTLNPDAPTMGAGNKIMSFGDHKAGYTTRTAGGILVTRSNEHAFATDEVAFKAGIRVDGDIMDSAAVALLAVHA